MQRIILHIDFDSFFASVAQQVNPLYRNRPLGVTATNGRTAIIAASREAKALGIKSPSRTYDAQRICPSIILTPADFRLYWEISKKFIDICQDYSPFVEIFSLDEVFMDATQTAKLFGGPFGIVEKIKSRLKEEVGEYITASFGISHNKLLSKLASGLEKPNGVVEINADNLEEIYEAARLTDICGIGNRIHDRLQNMGIRNLIQLKEAPLSALVAEFGQVEGNFLKNVGLGIDHSAVIPHTDSPGAKSVGRSYCLPSNEYDMRKALQNVYELCEEVALKLRRLNKKARGVGFYLRGSTNSGVHHTTDKYMNTGKDLFEIFTRIFKFPQEQYIRHINIWAYHLHDSAQVPSSLFLKEQREQKLTAMVDTINERFGPHTIRNGFVLYADKLTTVPNGFMADRYELSKFANDEKTRLANLDS